MEQKPLVGESTVLNRSPWLDKARCQAEAFAEQSPMIGWTNENKAMMNINDHGADAPGWT